MNIKINQQHSYFNKENKIEKKRVYSLNEKRGTTVSKEGERQAEPLADYRL
jgi:tRNA G37 N-methylase Trm5